MTKYIQSNNYETTQFEDEWIILNTDNFTVTKLNEVGGFCWLQLSEAKTIDSIHDAVTEKFSRISETAKDDIEEFLINLIQCGLVSHVS